MPEMHMFNCSQAENHHDLINDVVNNGIIKDGSRGAKALRMVDRIDFVSQKDKSKAYYDQPLQLYKQSDESQPYKDATIEAPHMHAHAINFLQGHLKEGAHALDVGCGSGYFTAVIAHLVGSRGQVIGVELIDELADDSLRNLANHKRRLDPSSEGEKALANIQIIKAADTGSAWGYDKYTYDVIHVGAGAKEEAKDALIKQLRPGGRMLIPMHTGKYGLGKYLQIDKKMDGSLVVEEKLKVRFVPLKPVTPRLPGDQHASPSDPRRRAPKRKQMNGNGIHPHPGGGSSGDAQPGGADGGAPTGDAPGPGKRENGAPHKRGRTESPSRRHTTFASGQPAPADSTRTFSAHAVRPQSQTGDPDPPERFSEDDNEPGSLEEPTLGVVGHQVEPEPGGAGPAPMSASSGGSVHGGVGGGGAPMSTSGSPAPRIGVPPDPVLMTAESAKEEKGPEEAPIPLQAATTATATLAATPYQEEKRDHDPETATHSEQATPPEQSTPSQKPDRGS